MNISTEMAKKSIEISMVPQSNPLPMSGFDLPALTAAAAMSPTISNQKNLNKI